MNKILYIIAIVAMLFMGAASSHAQMKAFWYSYDDSVKVEDSIKVHGQWYYLERRGIVHGSGFADCKNAALLGNKLDFTFDTTIITAPKSSPTFAFGTFSVKANLGTGLAIAPKDSWNNLTVAQLEASLNIVFFTDFDIWVSPMILHYKNFIGGIAGGFSKTLFTTGKD